MPLPVGPVTMMMPWGRVRMDLSSIMAAGLDAEPVQVVADRRGVEDSHDHLLAVDGRDGRDAHVDVPAGNPDPQTPVLGQPALRDVHLREDLDPGDHGRVHSLGRGHDLAQQTIHPDAHGGRFGLRLDVHVAGAVLDRLPQQQIDEADDGGLVGGLLAAGFSIETILDGDALGLLVLGVVLDRHESRSCRSSISEPW